MPVRTSYTALGCAGAALFALATGAETQVCGTSTQSDAPPLYPLPQDGSWGFVGRDGEWRLAPQWRQVRPFSEGAAAVETDAGWGLIDSDGTFIVDPGAQDADRVIIAGETFALSPFKPMSDGCSAATPMDATPYYVSADGDTWTPPAFADRDVQDIGSFSEGLAWVRFAEDRVAWIDTAGELAIAPNFIDGGDFVNGRAPAAVNTENRGYIDRSGELVFPLKFILQEAGSYADGLAPVRLNDDAGYMGRDNWAIREIEHPDGDMREIDIATPFSDGRAAVRPAGMAAAPVWIDTQGKVAVDPQERSRLTICSDTRLPAYRGGLLPLVVGHGTNICGNTPDIRYEGPGDPRSGPEAMLWYLPWDRDKLVWLDKTGAKVIDQAVCRRAPGVAALKAATDAGDLAPGAYRMTLSGTATGDVAPRRADAPCNRSEFTMDGNEATNAAGPWVLSLAGDAEWQGKPVAAMLSLGLSEGIETGTYEIGATSAENLPSAYLWMSRRDAGPNAPRPATYTSQSGTLTLSQRNQTAITGTVEITFASRDAPSDEIILSARFNEIPYETGPEVSVVETTGAVTALDGSMPDDPLINFFTPAKAVESEDRLVLSLGEYGPKLELDLPAGHDGAFTAGPDADVSITFAGMPVKAEGQLERSDGRLSGNVTAELSAHEQVDGAGSVTVRFAEIPVESDE